MLTGKQLSPIHQFWIEHKLNFQYLPADHRLRYLENGARKRGYMYDSLGRDEEILICPGYFHGLIEFMLKSLAQMVSHLFTAIY